MMRQPIVETTLAGLRPTGVAGRRVVECWDQIDSYLRNGPGGDLADLFAEPVPQGGGIVWFAPEGASVQRFRDLPPDEQATLLNALAERLDRLDAEAARLLGSANASARLMGETLERAQQVPGAVEDALYAVDGRPVLVNWSMETEGEPSPVRPLKAFVRRGSPVPAAAAPEEPRPPAAPEPPPAQPLPVAVIAVRQPLPWWWLLWALTAATLAAAFYVLLPGCGFWANGGLVDYCPAPAIAAPAPPAPEERHTQALLAEIAQLEQRLSQAPRCPAPREQQTEFDRRIEQSGAKEGELTITLIWNTPSDLDLYVRCPSGETINFQKREACGGHLDVDANVALPEPNPVENVYFPPGAVKPGTYRIMVRMHRPRGNAPNRFQVRIKKGEQVIYHDLLAPSTPGNVEIPDVKVP